ncbi:UDP-N-acetylglucosamine transferase subunit ALG14 homolog isoform X2 [Rattus norvegicus]|uniref:UDP-N-acetylglucosamine transferase subunit ALG14 n=1 Tax=Rattus norvegicus TaxID=10116 RepID=A0A8L2UIZ1_RAT|nr:UDP-N-acetylglucosamine transferase subunit ALG14 homolog isoform X2 [Rattus norvegicus]|eukprot:XP_008759688.1 PREDICTED: UDP-N-acetylglucosamine transferase subunit ALG14 homolog isoform X2 [Rattus norvegicus]
MVCVLTLAASAGGLAVLLIVRLWAVLRSHPVTPRQSLGLLIVAGSGGHTAEILRLVGSLSGAYSPRHYVIAESDEMSAKKIHSLELARAQNDSTTEHTEYYLHRIPRSREVRQSWLSSVFTTLYSIWFSFPLVHRIKPDLSRCHHFLHPEGACFCFQTQLCFKTSLHGGCQERLNGVGQPWRCCVMDQEHVFLSVCLPCSLGSSG